MGPPRLQPAQVAPAMLVHVMFLLIMLFSAPERRAWHGALMACWRVGGYAPTRHLVFMRVLGWYRHIDMYSREKSGLRDVRTHLGPTRAVHARYFCHAVTCPSVLF